MASTQVNDPIYPELVMACGLHFLGLDSNIPDLKDTYGMSKSSVKQVINMFLATVDNNTDRSELQIKLLDPADVFEHNKLASKFAKISLQYQLMDGWLGVIDGWLACTEKSYNTSNQVNYYSGHYQFYGINVQAMCGPNLIFLFLGIAAPGKVNNMRAFSRCDQVLKWLEALSLEYYIAGDNAYTLSQKVLIPFSGAKKYDEVKGTFNFYLSQLRVRVEMTFGLLMTKWQILRRALNNSPSKNTRIIWVWAKLNDFCIQMRQLDCDEFSVRLHQIISNEVDPYSFGIIPVKDGGNSQNTVGYLPTFTADNDFQVDADYASINIFPSLFPNGTC
jgi:hypothetical protein